MSEHIDAMATPFDVFMAAPVTDGWPVEGDDILPSRLPSSDSSAVSHARAGFVDSAPDAIDHSPDSGGLEFSLFGGIRAVVTVRSDTDDGGGDAIYESVDSGDHGVRDERAVGL